MRFRVLALIVAALVLAVSASASAAPFTARLRAPNHSPTAGKKWWITVTAKRGAAKLSGSVRYKFLYSGSTVGRQAGHSFTGGVFHDWLRFPAASVGFPLTLRVVVKTKYGTVNLDWAINVHT